jgi:succinoglycan biosynthesis transport protein ExoP
MSSPQSQHNQAPSTTARSASGSRNAPRPVATVDPVRVLRQHWIGFTVWLLVGGVLGVGAYFGAAFAYPLYTSFVMFELRPQLAQATEIMGQDVTQEETVVRLAQTEVERMRSREVLLRAVQTPDVQKTGWSKTYRDADGRFIVDEAVEDLEKEIRAGHLRGTNLFRLTWSAHEAADVPVLLNTVSRTYLETRRSAEDARYNQTKGVFTRQRDALDDQIVKLKDDIRRQIIEKKLPAFEENAMQSQRALEEMAKRITEAKQQKSLEESRRTQLDAKLKGQLEPSEEDIRRAEQDPAMHQLNRDVNDLQIRRDMLKSRFGPDHPEALSSEHVLAAAKEQRAAALNELVKRDLMAMFKMTSDSVQGLERLLKDQAEDYADEAKRIEAMAAEVAELEAMKERLKRLQDERADVNKLIGELDLVRVREDARRVEVVQPAITPREMSFPVPQVMIPGVAILTLAVVVGIVFARELVDQRVRYTSDLAGIAGARMLGVVPELSDDPSSPKRPEFVVTESPTSVLAESMRQIAMQVFKPMSERGHRTLAVVSAMPDAGTTTVITNLAASASAMGRRVAVVGANFRRSRLADAFGVDRSVPGLSDVLAGRASLGSVIQHGAGGIAVIDAGMSPIIELLSKGALGQVLQELKSSYDVVLIDTPPAVVAAETMEIVDNSDATLLCVRAFRDQRGLVARLVSQIMTHRSDLLGLVLNRPQQTAGGYYKRNFEVMARYAKEAASTSAAGVAVAAPAGGAADA